MKKVAFLTVVIMFFASLSFAAVTPLKISLWGKVALPPIDTLRGIELGIGNYSPDMGGIQFNFIFSKTDDGIGLQYSIVTSAKNMKGVQFGFYNKSSQEMSGVQYGVINVANKINGLQLGFVNLADDLAGIQLGLINNVKAGNVLGLPFTVILNCKF